MSHLTSRRRVCLQTCAVSLYAFVPACAVPLYAYLEHSIRQRVFRLADTYAPKPICVPTRYRTGPRLCALC
eukprot:1563736-Rhodomonas_salina.4